MTKTGLMMGVAAGAVCLAASAMATEPMQGSAISIEQAASLLHYSNGNDQMRLEVAPNYSEELGWSVKGAAGTYLSDTAAIGLLVEYGTNKREYLSNLGFQLTDSLSFVGTIGMLEEHIEFVDDEDRQKVQQMEYGMSLKGAKNGGSFSGFELNGYLADAKTDSDNVEAGKLYGVQLLTNLDLGDTTHLKIGGGHEWLRWDGGAGDDDRLTFSAEGSQYFSDNFSLNARAKLGVSENVYGGGLAYNLSDTSFNALGLNYSFIDGRNEIEDDQRVMLSWDFGFGSAPSNQAADIGSTHGEVAVKPAADLAPAGPGNTLLADVTKRPSYLPERVLARSSGGGGLAACASNEYFTVFTNFVDPPLDPNATYQSMPWYGSYYGVSLHTTEEIINDIAFNVGNYSFVIDGTVAGPNNTQYGGNDLIILFPYDGQEIDRTLTFSGPNVEISCVVSFIDVQY